MNEETKPKRMVEVERPEFSEEELARVEEVAKLEGLSVDDLYRFCGPSVPSI
jgi:hypothetical protein